MRELSLFTGIGGGLLGSKLLGWTTIGYVEWSDYCVKVLDQRIKDGILDDAPIFHCDIHRFIKQGGARLYRGMAEVVTAGFPCQPWSAAGQERGDTDERNLWPDTIETIRQVGPRYVMLENVPRLLAHRYFGFILGDLAEVGYSGGWCCLPAYITGAPQNGTRLWIVVSANGEGLERVHQARRGELMQPIKAHVPRDLWRATPKVYRRGDVIPDRVERTRALGNAQVPALAAAAWRLLAGE